jgi:dynein assembly factor 3
MAEQEVALRAAEAALDAAGRSRACSLFRLQLVTGDLTKVVTGAARLADSRLMRPEPADLLS